MHQYISLTLTVRAMQTFKELFDAIINEKHGGFGPGDKHPPPNLDVNNVSDGQTIETQSDAFHVRHYMLRKVSTLWNALFERH